MLPPAMALRRDTRVAAPPFSPSRPPGRSGTQREDAWARLRALGYVGAAQTSLGRQNLGEVLYRRGRLAAAERELRAVVAAQPSNLAAWLWLAKSLGDQGKAADALAAYRHAVGLPAGAHDALVEAVDLAVASRNPDAAQGLIEASGRSADGEVARAVARGTLAELRGRPQAAEREYRAALKADAASFEAVSRLFDLCEGAGRVAEALPQVARAAELAPDSARHMALLGTARLAAGDAAAARQALERALALAPDADPVRVVLGRALITEKRPAEAVAVLLPARASADRSVLLGSAYSSLGQWARAADELQSALQSGRVTTDVLNGLGWAQLKLGRHSEAADLFRRSLAANPDQPEIQRLLAGLKAPGPR
jgi:tetratricopeptide (TPR) repeat protein